MFRSTRRALMLGATIAAATLGAQTASATVFSFYGSNSSASATNALTYNSNDGSGLSLLAYGGHLSNTSGGFATSTGATVATYVNYGMGVISSGESASNGTHQIDNAGTGTDYVALVFNQAVTLSQIALQSYGGAGVGTGSDVQFRTYGGNVSDLFTGNTQLWEGFFSTPNLSTTVNRGSYGNYVLDTTGATASSRVWLLAANVTQSNDAFKLLGVAVSNSVPAVPEPASWAMMIVGLGMVGGAIRRRTASIRVAHA